MILKQPKVFFFSKYLLLFNQQIKKQNKKVLVGNTTLVNTKLEVSLPGFMKIDFVEQIRKEEKIGGGGCAIIYKGVILDPKLSEVDFSFFLFFFSVSIIIIFSSSNSNFLFDFF